jgi:HEAT repeat protein
MSRNRLLSAAGMQQQAAPAAAPVLPSRQKPVSSEMMKDDKYGGAAQIMSLPAASLIALLQDPGASVYARAKACQRLAIVGDKNAVPALAALLDSPQLSLYARTALETLPDRAADDALRSGLGRVHGKLLAGVINSIGKRRDANALGALEKLRHHSDTEVAGSANAALARIRPPL